MRKLALVLLFIFICCGMQVSCINVNRKTDKKEGEELKTNLDVLSNENIQKKDKLANQTGQEAASINQQENGIKSNVDAYSKYDLNGDGYITQEELKAAMVGPNILKMFKNMDIDGDGKIHINEIKSFLQRGEKKNRVPIFDAEDEYISEKQMVSKISPDLADIPYGEHSRNILDVYKAKSDKPTPVVIFFHGGGFSAGSKDVIRGEKWASFVEECLKEGISVISASYRLIHDAPFPAMMLDGVRVVQFVRWKAAEWNIDAQRIALSGGSAGANMSLWIAFKDDFANPKSEDPVERLSSRVSCAVVTGAQTSNDPQFIYEHIYRGEQMHPSLFGFYSIQSADEIHKPEMKKLAYEASSINFVTEDDPPVYLDYNGELLPGLLPEGTNMGIIIHNPKFGEVLKQRMDDLGIECVLRHKDEPSTQDEKMEFLKKHFKK